MKTFRDFYAEYMAVDQVELNSEEYQAWVDTAIADMCATLAKGSHSEECRIYHSHACKMCTLQYVLELYKDEIKAQVKISA